MLDFTPSPDDLVESLSEEQLEAYLAGWSTDPSAAGIKDTRHPDEIDVPHIWVPPAFADADDGGQFWRQEDPVIDAEGVLVRGGMFPSQREWFNLTNFIRLFVGGYGSGKTLTLCKHVLQVTIYNSPAPSAIVSPTYAMAKETTIETMRSVLEMKALLHPGVFKWREVRSSPHLFEVQYHGLRNRILVYSGQDADRLKGTNLGMAAIDEPFIQTESVFNQMIARVRHPQAKIKCIDLSGTPEQLNWGYDLAEGELADKHDVGVVRASTRENVALGQEYIDHLMASMTEKAALAYIEGHFLDLATGLVYYAFNRLEQVVEQEMPDGAVLGAGMDFNVDPMAAAVFWQCRGHVHWIEDIEIPNSDTEEMCDLLREKYGVALNDVYPDASGNQRSTKAPGGISDFSIIRAKGFEIHTKKTRIKNAPTNGARRDRWNAVNGKFKPTKDGELTMTVSPRCKRLIKYLSIFSHENMTKQAEFSHLLDAFSYPMSFLFPIRKNATKVARVMGS